MDTRKRQSRIFAAVFAINAIAMDSKGNIYTGEVEENKRIQKFVRVIANN